MFAIKWRIPMHVVYGVPTSPISIDPEIKVPSLESLLGIQKENQNAQENLCDPVPDHDVGVRQFR